MDLIKHIFILVFASVAVLGNGCKSVKLNKSTSDSTLVTETLRAIPVKLPGADVQYRYIIRCDDRRKPQIIDGSGRRSAHGTWHDRQGSAFSSIMLDTAGVLYGFAGCDSLKGVVYAKDREIIRIKKEFTERIEKDRKKWYQTAIGEFLLILMCFSGAIFLLSKIVK
jgi:hypothetical protein